jgi:hypothetical protein
MTISPADPVAACGARLSDAMTNKKPQREVSLQ